MSPLPSGTVTFLFTDIEGSTQLLQRLGDDGYAHVFAEHRRLLRAAFEAGSGHEIETQGDGFLVAFQSARDAVLTALVAQRAIAVHAWPDGAVLRIRMGLDTAEATLHGETYVGLGIHRAARICTSGWGGQILLSRTIADVLQNDLPEGVSLRDLGEHRLKDLQRPEKILQLLHADLPADFPPLRSLDRLPNNLPRQLTSFIGREREMAEVTRLLSATHLLTLTGSGGCGKTRLALQVAADLVEAFADGVWLVELAPLSDPALVPQTVASTLHVREEPGRPLLATLSEYLQLRHTLLLLDNCEHLVGACAQLAEALLRACPYLRILATTREPLRIAGETTLRVPSLSSPDPRRLLPRKNLAEYEAVRLFMDRAETVLPGFLLTDRNAPAVAQVCHRLDGIPLAIELAAARVKVLTPEQIALRLDDRFRLLRGGSRTALPQHQTLRATIDWSYDLLSEPERILFRRLSVFAGGWTLEALEAVCEGDDIRYELLELLTQLVDRSLVMMEGEQSGKVRYRLLETVRQYGREKLRDSGEGEAVQKRHRDWYLGLAERAEPLLLGPAEASLDQLEVEHDNLRAALELSLGSGETTAGLQLAGALWRFWQVRGFWVEGRQWLEAALAMTGGTAALRGKALSGAAVLAQYQGDYERAVALSEESLAIHRERGDRRGIASSLNVLGNVMYEKGNYPAARELHEESLAYGREVGDKHAIAASLVNLASVADHEGDYERAATLCAESLTLFREVRDKRGSAFTLNMLGILASDQGDYVVARARYEESLALRRELGDKRGIAASLSNLGRVASDQGDYVSARARYEESLALRRELGDKHGIAASLRSLGFVAWRQGDYGRATTLLEESLVMRKAQGNLAGIAESLEGLARAAQHPERTARLLGAASNLRDSVGAPLPPSDRQDHDDRVNAVRTTLGEKAFAAAWDQGRAMTLDQAIEYALTRGGTRPITSSAT